MKFGMKVCVVVAAVLLLGAEGLFAQAQQPTGTAATSGKPPVVRHSKPNIVLFLIDDLGWADLGVTGSTYYESPNLDRMAKEGVFFSDAYAASPVCTPTRASIQTGKYPSRIKMSYLAGSRGAKGPNYPLIPPQVAGNMPHGDITLAEALKEAGYTTAHIGKWHLQGHSKKGRENFPEKHGFDINIAGHNAGQPGSYYFPYKSARHAWSNVPDMEDGQEGDYLTDALTDRAIGFIEANQDGPFFLNMCYYTVHTPIQPRKDKLEKYRKKAQAMGLDKTNREAVPDHQSFTHAHQDNPNYAAMVESMDENIGRILDALKRLGLENDTIVVFFSDNGGLSTGGGPSMPTSNLPLRAGKAWVYEGGIRVPCVIKYPRIGKSGLKISEPVVSTDIYPTLLDLAGLPLRPQQHVDGVSLKPLVTGEKESLDREAIYFHLPHYHHINSMGPSGAVRRGDYKLIEVFETGKVELYNLSEDIGETRDLAGEMPELAEKLKRMLDDWRQESGSLMATRNPGYVGKQAESKGPKRARSRSDIKKRRVGENPFVENKPVEISCRVVPGGKPDGVLVAQGGKVYGYAVYVQNGKPCFSVRNKQKLTTIISSNPAPAAPFEIKAALAAGGAMSLRVDGVEVASGNAGSLITVQPAVGFSIGDDTFAPVGPYELPFAYAGKVSDVVVNGKKLRGSPAVRAAPKSGKTKLYTPQQDKDGLKANREIRTDLPNVLIIGDSISIGYTKPTIERLKDVANVQRVKANCGDTKRGLEQLKRWLGDTPWDVIHFNWGLHDLCYRHPDSKAYGRRDKVNGIQAVPLDQYEKNLETLVQKLKETGARLIWAATTVIPEGEAGRVVGDDLKYNAVAAKIMQKHGIAINDLHTLTSTFPPEHFVAPGDVHYVKDGSARLARQVAQVIADNLPAAAQETLAPLTDDVAPRTFDEMWKGFDPRAEPLEVEVLKEWEEDGVVLRALRYRIGIFKGQKALMAGVYGYPQGGKHLPGLVQIHGGGQYADYKAALTNAQRGYATISIAWAGRISAPDYRVTPKEVKLYWENKTDDPAYKLTTDWGVVDGYHAPSRNPRNVFPSAQPAAWTLDDVESPRNSPWFLCALGARRALTFLEQQPEVDRERLGVYGHSMGGKLTVMTAAADARVKAAAPSCGGISDRMNKSELFRATVGDDPSLKHIACPIIFLSPSNDFHGRINDLPKTIGEIASKQWRVTCAPHHNHQDTANYEVATQLWFDQYLKGTFTLPQTPKTELTLVTGNGVPSLTVRPDASQPILSVDVFYTQQGQVDGLQDDRNNTINRFWHHATPTKKGSSWVAELPLLGSDSPLWVYANVVYPLDQPVTGAGYYYGIYTTDRFNLSSLLHIVTADQLKAAGVRATLQPSQMIETFEDDWEKEWFTYKPAEWARRTHKVYDPRWAAPEGAKLSLEVRAEQANKLVVGIDQYAAEVALSGGTAWENITLSAADLKDAAETVMPGWTGIKELRLVAMENLRAKKNGNNTMRRVGAQWKGAPPEFRNLRWLSP